MLKHPESRGFLIDGFPRELDQGSQFEQGVCSFVSCSVFFHPLHFICINGAS